MSPQIALHDPVFRAYFWIVLISLAIAGAVLGFLIRFKKGNCGSMFKTYRSWIHRRRIGFMVVFPGRIPIIAASHCFRSTLSTDSRRHRDCIVTRG